MTLNTITMNAHLNLSFRNEELDAAKNVDQDETEEYHCTSGHGEDTCSSSGCSSDNDDDDDDGDDDFDDQYDSCSSLDGMIPSVSGADSAVLEVGPPISIHYLGREYKADELNHSLQVLQDSTIMSFSSSRHNSSGHRLTSNSNSRRSSTASSSSSSATATSSGQRRRNSSMSLSQYEHLNDRWAALEYGEEVEEKQERQEEKTTSLMRRPNNTCRNRRSSTSSINSTNNAQMGASLRRSSIATARGRRASITTMGCESEQFGSIRRSLQHKNMISQSEHFGSTRRSSTTDLPQSHHAATFRRVHTVNTSASGYFSSLVGKVNTRLGREASSAKTAKADRWNAQLERWGYSNHDVLCVVQDDQIFAKLQRDLRERNAVTNGTIQQKIHVFVHNTRSKQLQEQERQARRQSRKDRRQQEQQQRLH